MPQGSTIPAQQAMAATDRKEAGIDTEIIGGIGVGPPTAAVRLYQNYNSFQNVVGANTETKQRLRDTNLGGPGAGLPQGTMLKWFEWRIMIETLNANLSLPGNINVFEQMERLRETGYFQAVFSRTPFLAVSARDLTSFCESRYLATTVGGATVMAPSISERGGRSVETGDQPFVIVGMESNWLPLSAN
jgi:hypothetical protein